MKVSWFSTGTSSFIATYLARESVDKIIYIHIEDQHKDSLRYLKDCEKVLEMEIEILSSQYKNVERVVKQFKYINGVGGAPCTNVLKRRVRKEWEKQYCNEDLTYVWGYDMEEKNRINRILDTMSEFKHEFPLVDRGLTKSDAHAIAHRLGIKRPRMYDLGYSNNNCIGCVKGGMGYWNKIRVDFPDVFEKRAKLEREIGASCINGVYLDELDSKRGRMENEIMEDCSIFCQIEVNKITEHDKI